MEHVCLHIFRFNTNWGAQLWTEAHFDCDPRSDKPGLNTTHFNHFY